MWIFFFRGGGGGGGVITKSDYFFFFFFFLGGGGGGGWAAKFQIFLGMPDIPEFFFLEGGLGVNSRCWVQAYVGRKLRISPGVSLGTDLYFYSSLVWRARH